MSARQTENWFSTTDAVARLRRVSAGLLPPRRLMQLRRLRSRPALKYSMAAFDQLNCVFVHIPKTAGVSISTALFGTNAGGHQTMAEYLWLYGPRELERRFVFTFVRNPWERLYSAWRFLRAGGTEPANAAFGRDVLGQYPDFDTFVQDWLTPRSAHSSVHFVPQVRFLQLLGRNEAVDFVGRFERLEHDFAQVATKLGSAVRLEHLNQSPVQGTFHEAYSNASRLRASQVYAEDIQRFGYRFD